MDKVSNYTEVCFFPGVVVKRRGDREARVIDALCAVVTGALLTLTVVGWVGLARVLLAFAFAVYVPGWAVVTNFMPKTRASRAALPVLTSLTVLTAAATFTLWLHAWHPMQLFDIEAVASIAMMSVGAIRRERRRLHDEPSSSRCRAGKATDEYRSRWFAHGSRFAASDALLPISVILWIVGVRRIHPSPVPLSVLPAGSVVVFLAGLGVLVLSTGLLLARRNFSTPRMALHLGALIVMLYGTAPIVYREPRFAWVFKHTAFTNYIAVYHALGRSLDIYRIWPGFFALAAWIDKVAGVSTPLVYASWAELFFEILYAVELAWILRALRLDERERWLALFLFAGANWIAQDYFSPQGFGLVLSLGVFGMALHWLKGEQRPWVTKLEHLVGHLLGRVRTGLFGRWMLPTTTSSRREHPRATTDQDKTALEHPANPSHWFAVVALLFTYGVLTFVHELSPYVVAAQFCALVIIGLIRPWWLVVAMLAIAVGFLAPNFTYVNDNYGLTASIGNFFGNVQGPSSLLVEARTGGAAECQGGARPQRRDVGARGGRYRPTTASRAERGWPCGGRLLARSTPRAPRVRERGCASRLSLLLALDRMPCGVCTQSRARNTLAEEGDPSNRRACGSHRSVRRGFLR